MGCCCVCVTWTCASCVVMYVLVQQASGLSLCRSLYGCGVLCAVATCVIHMLQLPHRGQRHGDAGALTGSAIQITEALQAGRKRLRSCQWTVNTGGLISSVHCDRSAVCPSGRAPRSFSLRAANRCIDLDPQWSPGEGGSPSHTLGPGREETTAFFAPGISEIVGKICGEFYN